MNKRNRIEKKSFCFFKNNRILILVDDNKLLAKIKSVLANKYVLDTANNFNKNKFSSADLIILDQNNYYQMKNKFVKNKRVIPKLLIKNKKIKGEKALPVRITEVIDLPLRKSIFLNRIKLILNRKKELYQYQLKLKYFLLHDQLTGLYNRQFLNKYLIKLKNKKSIPISFIVVNIDSLKAINKKYGHNFGDQIVKETATILSKLVGLRDYIIRTGGDEFLIILLSKNLVKAEKIVEKIEVMFYNNLINKVKVSLGIGVATWSKLSQSIESVITTAMTNMYLNKLSKKESTRHRVISAMIKTLEAKSFETYDHAERMKKLAVNLGKSVNLNKKEIDELKLLSDLHDLGKVAIPESILKKPAKLTKTEFEIIKKHPRIGYEIIKNIPELQNVGKAVLAHHERWDGSGYPQGLKEYEIPILARIITIIDAFDVMLNQRAYKKAYSFDYTIGELKRFSGSQFDPYLIAKFLKNISSEKINFNKILLSH